MRAPRARGKFRLRFGAGWRSLLDSGGIRVEEAENCELRITSYELRVRGAGGSADFADGRRFARLAARGDSLVAGDRLAQDAGMMPCIYEIGEASADFKTSGGAPNATDTAEAAVPHLRRTLPAWRVRSSASSLRPRRDIYQPQAWIPACGATGR